MSLKPPVPNKDLLRRLHIPPHKYIEEWLDAPAHIHHTAHRMANPALERPQTRKEFQALLLGVFKSLTPFWRRKKVME